MPDAREVYQRHPEEYDSLVRHEDAAGNLLPALRALAPLDGAEVVECGAGTGRVTALLAPHVRSIRAFDLAAPMLEVARRKLAAHAHCTFAVADNASLPVESGSADLSIAGWTYGHQTVWDEQGWRAPIERALAEMQRVLRPGGVSVVIETLGTGHETPFEPPVQLGRYYTLLEQELGFARTWVRTDYLFPSAQEGERLVRFFFGEERARRFAARGAATLPECTGLWSRRK
jgi:ubiquinone/menaquinone biosynthesis C-methylase UbiE